MAGRPKGLAKTGGRKKGTPNKSTITAEELRQKFLDYIGTINSKLFSDIDSLKPEDRVKAILRLIQIIMPAQTSMKLDITNIDEMKQMIATKYPFGGITPPDDKPKLEQEPDAPDQ